MIQWDVVAGIAKHIKLFTERFDVVAVETTCEGNVDVVGPWVRTTDFRSSAHGLWCVWADDRMTGRHMFFS